MMSGAERIKSYFRAPATCWSVPMEPLFAPRAYARVITPTPSLDWLLWLLGPLCFGLLALTLGQDANWDLRNYHYYNAYAFLHGRLDYDVAPAQVANFYNPLLHVPFYYLVTALPPRGVAFVLGAVQGLNLPLLYMISKRMVKAATPWRAKVLAASIALLGVLSAGNISELGTAFGDNVLSLLLLLALWFVVAGQPSLSGRWPAAAAIALAAGVLAGMATGLKQPAAMYALGLGLGLFGLPLPGGRRLALVIAFGIGGLVGLACTGGFWLYTMWTLYGNPLFPYFNQVFHSPMASAADYRDLRFLPQGLSEWLFFPLVFLFDSRHTAEVAFRDLRLPLLYCLGLILALGRFPSLFKVPLPGQGQDDGAAARRYLLLAGVISYLAWLKMFAIYRYLLTLEMLAPLGIWLLITHLVRDRRRVAVLAGTCAVLLVVTLVPPDWGRVAFGDNYFGVTPPVLADPDHTLVLMTGVEPTAYLIPSFPTAVRFLRIQSYFTGPSSTPNGFDRRMQGLITAHQGPMYVLCRGGEQPTALSVLRAYGLAAQDDDCQAMTSHIDAQLKDPLYFCRVSKVPQVSQVSMEGKPRT